MPLLRLLQRIVLTASVLSVANAVQAKALTNELTVNQWLSEGTTLWSFYNGESEYGNPTSSLEYKNTVSNIQEISSLIALNSTTFVRGKMGGFSGAIHGGKLYDGDYYSALGAQNHNTTQSGAHRFSYTESDVSEGQVMFLAGELGRRLISLDSVALDAYLGYQYWRESYSAENYIVLECTDTVQCGYVGYSLTSTGPIILNDIYWHSFYLGGDGAVSVSEHFALAGSLKYSPFVHGENDDTHVLRNRPNSLSPLGNPSFVTRGDGWGLQAELTATYQLNRDASLGLGYRYCRQKIASGTTTIYNYAQQGYNVPAVELYTIRQGWLLSLSIDL